jgi:hypothetical protein
MSILQTFRILIPEFQSLSDETVTQWLDLVNCEVTKTGLKPVIRDQIIIYLTADRMVNSFRQKGVSGEVVSVSEGGLSIKYANNGCSGYRSLYEKLIKAHTITPLTRMC